MNLQSIIDTLGSLSHSLVPALLHTLWIGALVAATLAAALRALPARRAELRYGLAVAALLALVAGGVAAWAAQEAWRGRAATSAPQVKIDATGMAGPTSSSDQQEGTDGTYRNDRTYRTYESAVTIRGITRTINSDSCFPARSPTVMTSS